MQNKKFLIQILIAIGISVLFQLIIDPLVYDPYIRDNLAGLIEAGDAIVICSLSMWFFSFSIVYFYYRENDILINYLLCAFIPLALIVGVEFSQFFFWDFLHIPPIIVIAYIFVKYRSHIKLKNVTISSIVLVIWMITVRLIGTNYTGVPLFPLGLIAVIAWPLINLLIAFIVINVGKKASE